MRKESLTDVYAELDEINGIQTLFRKFETGTFISQFKNDVYIGSVLVTNEQLQAINNAPSIRNGDGKTKQTL